MVKCFLHAVLIFGVCWNVHIHVYVLNDIFDHSLINGYKKYIKIKVLLFYLLL